MDVTGVHDLLAVTILKARTLSYLLYNEENNQESVCSSGAGAFPLTIFFWEGIQLLLIPSCQAVIYLMDMLEIQFLQTSPVTADLWQPPEG